MADASGDGPSGAAAPLAGLTDRVATFVQRAAPQFSGTVRSELERIHQSLLEPVRIAVAGSVNAGKSTLVNALVGQRVAPTDVSECTRLVTWYRYGKPQRLEVVLRDGTRRSERLGPGGRLPHEIGVDPMQVAFLDVWLTNETLRSMTLIDTPGLGSLNTEYAAATEALLRADQASREATAVADAVLFLVNNDVKQGELEALRAYRAASASLGGTSGNAIGVLSKADKLASGADWWETAQRVAKRLAARLQDEVVTVVPLAGLWAETAESASLLEDDAESVARLAALDPGELAMALVSVSRFEAASVPLTAAARTRLLELLDLQGIAAAVELVRDGVMGAAPVRRALSERSGIGEVRAVVEETFRDKGAGLKIRAALHAVERLCANRRGVPAEEAPALDAVADAAERLELDGSMHRLAEADALARCTAGAVSLPEEWVEEVRRMATGVRLADRLGCEGGDEAVPAAAVDGAARWRARAAGCSPQEAAVARVMLRSCALALEEVGPG